MRFLVLAIILLQAAVRSRAALKYEAVINQIRKNCDPDIIPIEEKDTEPLKISYGIRLERVLKVGEDKVELIMTQQISFLDRNAAWDKSKSGQQFEQVSVPSNYTWQPDLDVCHIGSRLEQLTPKKSIVHYDGRIEYEPRHRARVLANTHELNEYGVEVSITVMSKTYQIHDLIFEEPSEYTFDLRYFESEEFNITDVSVNREPAEYPFISGHFDKMTFNFTLHNLEEEDE